MKKKARKPSKIFLKYCGAIGELSMDPKMSNAWIFQFPLDLKGMKNLHSWLGKAIAYLDSRDEK